MAVDEDHVGAGGRRDDPAGIGLVAVLHPRAGVIGLAPRGDVPLHQPLLAEAVVEGAEPDLVQQRAHVGPVALVQEEVVPLREHDVDLGRHDDVVRDRLPHGVVEARCGDHRPTGVAHRGQHTGIRVGIEGVRGALAVTAPQPLELALVRWNPSMGTWATRPARSGRSRPRRAPLPPGRSCRHPERRRCRRPPAVVPVAQSRDPLQQESVSTATLSSRAPGPSRRCG